MNEDPLIGREIDGRLTVLERLSQGGMGVVYRAEHKLLGTMLALKVIHPSLVATPDIRRRFLREARAGSAVSDPRIVTVRDAGEVDGQLYFTMDLVEGRTIQEVLREQGSLDTRRAVGLAIQVLQALEAAHGAGIIHRDLKPGNVMLEAGDKVKVLDFGVAKWIGPAISGNHDALTMTGHVVGTLGYMAPEQITGDTVDVRTDLYALCVILYELLTGGRPHNAKSTASLLRQVVLEEPKPLVGPVGEVVMLGLSREPDDRPASATELRGLLETAAAGIPTEHMTRVRTRPTALEAPPPGAEVVRTTGPRGGGPRAVPLRRLLAVGALALAVLAGGAFIVFGGPGGAGERKTDVASGQGGAGEDEPATEERASPTKKEAASTLEQASAAWDRGDVAAVRTLLARARVDEPEELRRWTIARSLANLERLTAMLVKHAAAGGGSRYPRYNGPSFVLSLVVAGELDASDPAQRLLLFSPTDLKRAALAGPASYKALTRATLEAVDESIYALTSYAGRRNADRHFAITPDQVQVGTGLIADVSIPGVVLLGYTTGAVRRHAYADFDLVDEDFAAEFLGDAATHEELQVLYGGFQPGLDPSPSPSKDVPKREPEKTPKQEPEERSPVALPPPGDVDTYAWKQEPAPWLKGRAKELWGTLGENYLQPDPDLPTSTSIDDPRGNPEGTATSWYGSNPPHANALTLNESDFDTKVRQHCSEYLANSHTKNGYRYAPALAYRVEHSKDFKRWVIWLRPGVKWHKPQVDLDKYPHLRGEREFTAYDWKFTMDCIMDDRVNAAHYRAYFEGFGRVEVVDDHCFIMHWETPTFEAVSSNLDRVRAIPKFVYGFDESGNEIDVATRGQQINGHWFGRQYQFIGTGPYYVREFRKEDVVICERFAGYWGELPSIKRLVMQVSDGAFVPQAEFEAGNFAYHYYRLPDFKKRVQTLQAYKDGKIGETWVWSSSYTYIGYKNSHPIFRDVQVRRAMTHACNRVKMLDLINEGRGKILTGPSYWRAPTAPKDIRPLAFDLKKAAAMFKEAGWVDSDGNGILDKVIDGERVAFEVVAKIPRGGALMTVFNVFKEDLLKVGVKVEIKTLAWSQFLKEVTDDRDFEISALGWNTSGWDNDFTQIWHSSQIEERQSSNHIEFSDAEVDRLIDKARTTFDENERVKVQGALHRRLNSLQPYTFLFTLKTKVVWWKDQVSDLSEANQWVTRPFLRVWPVYVPRR